MKMFNNLDALIDGEIKNIDYKACDSVSKVDVLCYIEKSSEQDIKKNSSKRVFFCL